jgi:hypothetical protein
MLTFVGYYLQSFCFIKVLQGLNICINFGLYVNR